MSRFSRNHADEQEQDKRGDAENAERRKELLFGIRSPCDVLSVDSFTLRFSAAFASLRFSHGIATAFVAVGLILNGQTLRAQPFNLPTANRAIYDGDGGGEKFFVPTVGKPWTSGCFGCVRTEGWQMHEGLDIR